MPKAIVLIVAALLLLTIPGFSSDLVKSTIVKPQAITGEEQLPNFPYYPSSPGMIAQSPGDTVGFTQYDYQSNGSAGNRVVVDGIGNIHFAWMNGDPYPSTRLIYYNCLTPSGWVWPGIGTQVSYRSGDGYCQIDVTPDDRAVIAYHNARTSYESTFVALDFSNCLGTFNYSHPRNRSGGTYYLWPYIAVGRDGAIHYTITRNAAPDTILYQRSNNGGTTWTALQPVDISSVLAQMVVASPVSDKICIAYTRDHHDNLADSTTDVMYVQSLNGTTWDFAHPVNVTNYGTDLDSLGAGWDIDAIYDYNDNLHLVWYARWQNATSIYYWTHLFHYDVRSGTITEIAQTDSLWPQSGCTFGNYSWHFQKMSLGVQPNSNHVFVSYTDFDTSDCSSCGFANGDIYMHYSPDNGASWSAAINVTDSHTPLCIGGDCDSDNWPSMAEQVDSMLHIFYVNDRDAGAIPQTQCGITDNPMLYLAYPNPIPQGIAEGTLPTGFALSQNYPNPFNAQTTIGFELPRASRVSIEIFDVLGRKVVTLLDENRPAGPQQITWNAGNRPSGIYSYRLRIGEFAQTRKMLLVK